MNRKSSLGQFYSTRADYIFQSLEPKVFLSEKNVTIDPFAGNFDILNIIAKTHLFEAYDIHPVQDGTIKQNTLLNPPRYNGKWIFTNPPYLARNKNNFKTNDSPEREINERLFIKYDVNDLYKVFLKTLIEGNVSGGIIILPINFLSEEHSAIRKEFLSNYTIQKLNIFEEDVFDDTSYSVCSFSFLKSTHQTHQQTILTTIHPSKTELKLNVYSKFNYRLCGEFYDNLPKGLSIKIKRATKIDEANSNIMLRALDGGSHDNRIQLQWVDKPYVDTTPRSSERAFAGLCFSIDLTKSQQLELIEKFNAFIEYNRKKYNSLFLTNYRNSTSNYARKRISFDAAYRIIDLLLRETLHTTK